MNALTTHDTGMEKVPERTCIGCRRRAPAGELVRVVRTPESPPRVVPDVQRKLPGRGASLHPERDCFTAAARRRAFSRAFRAETPVDGAALAAATAEAYRRRVAGLLVSAHRAGAAAVGTDAVREALRSGKLELLLLANDVAGRSQEIEAAAERLGRRVVRFGTKADNAIPFGRAEVGVLGISSASLAEPIREAASRATSLSEVE